MQFWIKFILIRSSLSLLGLILISSLFQGWSEVHSGFRKIFKAVLCAFAIVSLVTLQFTKKLEMSEPESLCLNTKMNTSNEYPEMYFYLLFQKLIRSRGNIWYVNVKIGVVD